jgi:coenzyme F420-reducing hydrogenase alpha subunit
MSSVHAMEEVCGVRLTGPLRVLRRLIYCGEWIESHVLHIYMLHAPDFLGYESAIHMAKDHGDIVQRGLRLKKIGNDLVTLLGGREIHPINVRVGGFYRVPPKRQFQAMIEQMKWARDAALETVRWVAQFEFPDFEQDYEFVALRHPDEYPFNEGRLVSNRGLDIAIREFEDHFAEEHVAHSTALHAVLKARGSYFVGPQARYSLNYDKLSPLAQSAARDAGLGPTSCNPFQSIIVRAVETLQACDEAVSILENFEEPDRSFVEVEPKAGTGHGCSEAPRGLLYHRYETDEQGVIQNAKIIPPTSQNQKTVENDLRAFVPKHLKLPDDKLVWQCEQAIRNYDPCISCSTHFLKVKLDRD